MDIAYRLFWCRLTCAPTYLLLTTPAAEKETTIKYKYKHREVQTITCAHTHTTEYKYKNTNSCAFIYLKCKMTEQEKTCPRMIYMLVKHELMQGKGAASTFNIEDERTNIGNPS